MKTTFILSIMFAVVFHAKINCQTKNNNTKLSKTTIRNANSLSIKASGAPNSEAITKRIESINKKIEDLTKQINDLQKLKSEVNEEITLFFDGPPVEQLIKNAFAVELPRTEYELQKQQLIKKAEEIFAEIKAMESVSVNKKRSALVKKAKKEDEAYLFLIKAAETGIISSEKEFLSNRAVIIELMYAPTTSDEVYLKALSMKQSSDKYMRIAKQLQTEAYTLVDLRARRGALENVEEQMQTAIMVQNDAINLFTESYVCKKD